MSFFLVANAGAGMRPALFIIEAGAANADSLRDPSRATPDPMEQSLNKVCRSHLAMAEDPLLARCMVNDLALPLPALAIEADTDGGSFFPEIEKVLSGIDPAIQHGPPKQRS